MSAARDMGCMSCGERKAYPDGFPNRAVAECWQCAWDSHIRNQHPKVVRRIKREARRRARRLTERDVKAAMFEAERRQAFGPDPLPKETP